MSSCESPYALWEVLSNQLIPDEQLNGAIHRRLAVLSMTVPLKEINNPPLSFFGVCVEKKVNYDSVSRAI